MTAYSLNINDELFDGAQGETLIYKGNNGAGLYAFDAIAERYDEKINDFVERKAERRLTFREVNNLLEAPENKNKYRF